jgi:hypothetical protein
VNSETKHTALPWTYSPYRASIKASDGSLVGLFHDGHGLAVNPDDAELIVRAVNSHDELVEALKEMLASARPNQVENSAMFYTWQQARAALAKVEKGVQP